MPYLGGGTILKKQFYICFLVLIAAFVIFNVYRYREQNLGELVDINRVDKVYIVREDQIPEEFELIHADDETIKKLSDFLNQYEVKLTNKNGWTSDHQSERFELYLGYNDGGYEKYTFERDVVVTNRVYKVVNPPLDYKVIQKLEREIISNK
jgi:hypothetical protein